jgi:predicted MPP superfamily phosphohydrolase
MIPFLVTVIGILGLIHWFLYARLVSAFDITAPALLWLLRFLIVFLAVSYILARMWEKTLPEPIVHILHWISSVWLGLMWELLWLTLLFFIIKVIMLATGFWGKLDPATIILLGRYSAITVISVAVLLCSWAIRNAFGPANVVEVKVPVKNVTPELKKLRIVLASDIHAGVIVGPNEVRRMARQVESLKPDLILLPGDLVDRSADDIMHLVDAFKEFKAPLGVYGTTGNHEYYAGLDGALAFCKAAGIRMLMNEKVVLPNGLIIAGIEDRTAITMHRHRPSIEEFLADVPPDRPLILMDHQPETHEALAAGNAGADLMLSGHTHGGQLFPFTLLTRATYRFHHGYYSLNGKGHIIISDGIGHWGPPMRLDAPPEVVLITLE